eukprot:1114757-Pelagomonas_calceolata.AAC.8
MARLTSMTSGKFLIAWQHSMAVEFGCEKPLTPSKRILPLSYPCAPPKSQALELMREHPTPKQKYEHFDARVRSPNALTNAWNDRGPASPYQPAPPRCFCITCGVSMKGGG